MSHLLDQDFDDLDPDCVFVDALDPHHRLTNYLEAPASRAIRSARMHSLAEEGIHLADSTVYRRALAALMGVRRKPR